MRLETFFEKFEQFAETPNAVAKMREFVLQLAVQGKLVDQDINEGHAESLLKQIKCEKARLVKERLIKKQDTDPIGKDEELFSIPGSWVWTRLGEIGDWGAGSTPSRGNYELFDGGITWLKSGELNDNQALAGSEETITELAIKTCSFRMNRPGDVLLAMYGATIGKVAILSEPAVTNQAVCGCTPFVGVSNRYLFNFLLSQRAQFHSASEGGAQPNISKVKIVGFPFPLPPLAEQKRIVAKVDELMVLCDRLEAQQQERDTRHAALARAALTRFADAPTPTNLNLLFHSSYAIVPADIRKTILTLAVQGKIVPQDVNDEPASQFVQQLQIERKSDYDKQLKLAKCTGDRPPKLPRNNYLAHVVEGTDFYPHNWCETRVGDISDCLDHLRVPVNKSERIVAHGTVPYYGANGQVGLINKHLFDEDLVLVVEDETFIGRTKPFSYIVRGKSWVNNHAHVLRPLGRISADFLNLVLCQYPFIPLTSGTTARRKLTQPSLMDARLGLPPLAEQRRIVAKVDQLMALVDRLETELTASRTAAANLMDAVVAELTAVDGP